MCQITNPPRVRFVVSLIALITSVERSAPFMWTIML